MESKEHIYCVHMYKPTDYWAVGIARNVDGMSVYIRLHKGNSENEAKNITNQLSKLLKIKVAGS